MSEQEASYVLNEEALNVSIGVGSGAVEKVKEVVEEASQAINITNIGVNKEQFFASFQDESSLLLDELLTKLKDPEDMKVVQEVAMKMIALYQDMYNSDTDKVAAVQRSLNNYKSVIAAISARYQLDVANTIVAICKKAAVIALSVAVSFVAL